MRIIFIIHDKVHLPTKEGSQNLSNVMKLSHFPSVIYDYFIILIA